MARILFVTARLPYPPTEGHQLRSWHFLRALARHHDVDLLSMQGTEDGDPAHPELAAVTRSVTTVPLPGIGSASARARLIARSMRFALPAPVARFKTHRLAHEFVRLARNADIVHLDLLHLAHLMSLISAGTPVVLNAHNVESSLLAQRAGLQPSAMQKHLLHWQSQALASFEATAVARATLVLCCSQTDCTALLRMAPSARIEVVPNGVDLGFFQPGVEGPASSPTLVFAGGMGWLPNKDGIEHFLSDTFLRIRKEIPARLTLIGNSRTLRVPPGMGGAVFKTGFVEDLRPLVHSAHVYILPLRAGSGTRLKLLEAMAMGKAIVSTSIGAEGVDVKHGEDILLADTPAAFAESVIRLFKDDSLRHRLGQAARKKAEALYGWDRIGQSLHGLYAGLPHPGQRAIIPVSHSHPGLGSAGQLSMTRG